MKIAIIIIIFIAGLIIIHLKQKISDLEDEIQYLANLLQDAPKKTISVYELVEDEDGNVIDKNGKRLRMQKVEVDKKKKM